MKLEKKSYVELMKEKLQLTKELQECNTKGDKILLTRQLEKVDKILKDMEETTVSGDIAVAPAPMNKDKIIKRPKLGELDELEESVNFGSFFDLDANSDTFKR
jgi:hypothetical protein